VDYRTVAGKALCEMSTLQVHHLLVVCALVSGLYCPRYNPAQALPKDSKLARTALRYKIDTGKLTAEVRIELLKKAGENRPQPETSSQRKQKDWPIYRAGRTGGTACVFNSTVVSESSSQQAISSAARRTSPRLRDRYNHVQISRCRNT
jgi:hypothetical protein